MSQEQAEYIMGAAVVAGGWIMIGDEIANRVRTWDTICGLVSQHQIYYLAALPPAWTAHMRDVSTAEVIAIIRADLDLAKNRTWAVRERDNDVAILAEWLARVESIKPRA